MSSKKLGSPFLEEDIMTGTMACMKQEIMVDTLHVFTKTMTSSYARVMMNIVYAMMMNFCVMTLAAMLVVSSKKKFTW